MESYRRSTRNPTGMFVGTATLDVIQRVASLPGPDEKIVATDRVLAAGGPAANAAVAFVALGGSATLVTRIGDDAAGALVANDLKSHGVSIVNLSNGEPTAISSILVTESTGERAVISTPMSEREVAAIRVPVEVDSDIVVVDSYETDLSGSIAREAQLRGIPVILDCGTKKPQTDRQLMSVSCAVVSHTYLDGGPHAIRADLQAHGVAFGVITSGQGPITFWCAVEKEMRVLPVPDVTAVDTLGAGDFFHGAFAFAAAQHGLTCESLPDCVQFAQQIATESVQHFGSRTWLAHI